MVPVALAAEMMGFANAQPSYGLSKLCEFEAHASCIMLGDQYFLVTIFNCVGKLAPGAKMEILSWLVVNSILPLMPIGFFYLGFLIIKGSIQWIPPIRDGQVCFYSTTIAIITIKDIIAIKADGFFWLFGLVFCWLVSFFVYSVSVYSTIYPSPADTERTAIDGRVALASIFCGILTTATVVGLRLEYGVLK